MLLESYQGGSLRTILFQVLVFLTRGEVRLLTSSLAYRGSGGFNWRTILFNIGVLTQGGGVLYESFSPNLEASNPSERFVTDIILVVQSQGRILITGLILAVWSQGRILTTDIIVVVWSQGRILITDVILTIWSQGRILIDDLILDVWSQGTGLNKWPRPCYKKSRDRSLTFEQYCSQPW